MCLVCVKLIDGFRLNTSIKKPRRSKFLKGYPHRIAFF